jgi:F0F1-type ATP synthase membrane subunit b/b'
MVAAPEKLIIEQTEPERLLEDFRIKLIHSLRREMEKMEEIANKDAKLILTKAYQESSDITTKAQEESKRIISQSREKADKEAAGIVSNAQERAVQIVNNAEEIIRKDAKERTRKEIETLMRNSKDEAVKQATKTLQTAKEEAANIISESKNRATLTAHQIREDAEKETQELTREVKELKEKAAEELAEAKKKSALQLEQLMANARKTYAEKAEKEANEIVSQAKARAQKEREYILANALTEAKAAAEAETARLIQKAKEDAEVIVMSAKDKVRSQIDESSRLMLEIQQRMQQVIGVAGYDNNKIDLSKINVDIKDNKVADPVPAVNASKQNASRNADSAKIVDTSKSKPELVNYDEERQTYQGKLRIDVAPPVDGEQLTLLEEYLSKTSGLHVIIKGGAEDGSAWVEIEAKNPSPLLDILRNMPNVKDVVGCKSYIIVALKSRQLA